MKPMSEQDSGNVMSEQDSDNVEPKTGTEEHLWSGTLDKDNKVLKFDGCDDAEATLVLKRATLDSNCTDEGRHVVEIISLDHDDDVLIGTLCSLKLNGICSVSLDGLSASTPTAFKLVHGEGPITLMANLIKDYDQPLEKEEEDEEDEEDEEVLEEKEQVSEGVKVLEEFFKLSQIRKALKSGEVEQEAGCCGGNCFDDGNCKDHHHDAEEKAEKYRKIVNAKRRAAGLEEEKPSEAKKPKVNGNVPSNDTVEAKVQTVK